MNDPSGLKVASDALEHVANGADKAFSFATELASALGTSGAHATELAEQLAKAAGTGAARLTSEAWEILVRQQVAAGAVGLFRWALGWGTFYMLVRASRAAHASVGGFTRENGPTRATWLGFACSVVFLAQFVVGYLEVPTALMRIINPRYYAAVELIQAARMLK